MDSVGLNALKRASHSGPRSSAPMPNQQQALAWKALPSGKPKIEPNEINDLLYANVGALGVPGMVSNGSGVQPGCVVSVSDLV